MYQNYLKNNTCAMTIYNNLIMMMICGYTILIRNYSQISFVNRYPRVLTYEYHDGGYDLI